MLRGIDKHVPSESHDLPRTDFCGNSHTELARSWLPFYTLFGDLGGCQLPSLLLTFPQPGEHGTELLTLVPWWLRRGLSAPFLPGSLLLMIVMMMMTMILFH